MMSYHVSPMWHEWNVNCDDIMMTWFAYNAIFSDIMSRTHSIVILAQLSNQVGQCAQADPHLAKITASHFQVLNTQKCKWEHA